MNAVTLLAAIAETLTRCRLEAILIGNAAAALQGAPVTTMDFDFFFRATPLNRKKLREFAGHLNAYILRPYYPVSSLFRVINDDRGLQVDFLSQAHGIRSFESLRARSQPLDIGGYPILVADLADVIASKRAAKRNRDLAVLEVLETTLHEQEKLKSKSPSRP